MTGGQSWPNYIGSKRGHPQVCLTNPVFTPFPLKVAWSGISLITGRGGGATKWQNRWSETFWAPPSRQGKTFHAPPFKEWKLFAPHPFNMAKTSSYCVKTTPKLFLSPPPFSMAKTFSAPPLLLVTSPLSCHTSIHTFFCVLSLCAKNFLMFNSNILHMLSRNL